MFYSKQIRRIAIALLVAAAPLQARAEAFPGKPVKIIVPNPAGAGTDTIARIITGKLAEKWKQPIVVENRAGADGIIGSQLLVKASPDGYTLMIQGATHVTNQYAHKDLPYDTVKSFTPLGIIATSPYVLATSPQMHYASLEQLLADVRAKPDLRSVGVGDNSTRLIAAVIGARAKVNLQGVPYKGGAPMISDLMAGHVPLGISSVSSTFASHKAGKIKIIAVLGNERSQALETIPTAGQQGLSGDYPLYWFGLFGPANMDRALAAKISKDFAEVLSMPETRNRFIEMGIDPVGSTPAQFADRIQADLKLWSDLISQTGIRLDN